MLPETITDKSIGKYIAKIYLATEKSLVYNRKQPLDQNFSEQ